ncbi:hypothetical protein [uncultured Chryseobacterium sp.]|uniref:hypothetical protein n=1 Tax=uncultured Chryseobacterium sp. TaxID=259322 RepID=UPI0025E48B51|nr:hypothetical protein [uncultured Chryseobacterium sp.]
MWQKAGARSISTEPDQAPEKIKELENGRVEECENMSGEQREGLGLEIPYQWPDEGLTLFSTVYENGSATYFYAYI